MSITEFSIVIGSARDHVGVQLQVSNLNFCNWIIVYPSDLHGNYARFSGFNPMFRTVFNNFESATDVFAQKNFPKDILNS